jgi:phage portal protein BeeE
MGYPDDYKLVVSDTQAYRQFGNSVVVPVVEKLAKAVKKALSRPVGERPDLVLEDKGKSGKPTDATNDPIRKSVTYPKGKRGAEKL